MKKATCNSCRALSHNFKCDLGFEVRTEFMHNTLPFGAVPMEICPKPKTVSEYIRLMQKKRGKRV